MSERRPTAPLSMRELEVLALVAEGQSAKSIGRVLALSPRTVERFIESCRHKLDAANMAHLVAKAMTAGYLPLEHRDEIAGLPRQIGYRSPGAQPAAEVSQVSQSAVA